jgi:hypothetical protein
MSGQEFASLAAGRPSLLEQVESIVLDAHRSLYEREGREWSKPIAYRWLHYEDPMPVARLREGVEKLRSADADLDAAAVDKACAEALKMGFSS